MLRSVKNYKQLVKSSAKIDQKNQTKFCHIIFEYTQVIS